MLTSNKGSIGVGRIAGIPLRISYSVIALSTVGAIFLATQILPRLDSLLDLRSRLIIAITAVAAFLGSILAHELGHALVARRFGVATSSIRLWILGGVAALVRQAPTPKAEFWIAVAGPLVNAFLAVALFGLANLPVITQDYPILQTVGFILAATNLILALSNVIPAAPLDGGRILTAWLWWRSGDAERARLTSARCGLVFGTLVFGFGLFEVLRLGRSAGWITVMIGAFLVLAARSEVVGAFLRNKLIRTTPRALMTMYPQSVHHSLPVGQMIPQGADAGTGYPVTRWDHSPIGYVCVEQGEHLDPVETSWTTVGHIMSPAELTPRAWANESIDTIFRRLGESHPLIVIHDPSSGAEIGTLTRRQVQPLLALPDVWGRDKRTVQI